MLAASIAVSIKKRFGMYLSVCLFVPPLHQALNQDEAAEMASLVNVLTWGPIYSTIIIRLCHRYRVRGLLVPVEFYVYSVDRFVYPSVNNNCEFWKNGSSDRVAVWVDGLGWPKKW